jgi:hypothetical protein
MRRDWSPRFDCVTSALAIEVQDDRRAFVADLTGAPAAPA